MDLHKEKAVGEHLSYKQFKKVEMRVGTIKEVKPLEGAIKPAYILKIDFGTEIGLKKTSAQVTKQYNATELPGKQVIAVMNFPPKQIGKSMSEVLVLGADTLEGVVLLSADKKVENGQQVY